LVPEKKRKKIDDDDEDPFDLDDEFFERLNEQMNEVFRMFPGAPQGKLDFTNDMFKKMFINMFKQLGVNPKDVANMNEQEIREFMKNANINLQPFIFGMNMGFGPDGKPKINSFGNVKPNTDGEAEIQDERDPLVDIYEEDGKTIVVVEVPGIDKESIELKASPYELEISAESQESGFHPRKYHKIITLPSEINPDVAKARYQNGILEVKLTKVGHISSKKKIKIE
jgi:HSP20 family protein